MGKKLILLYIGGTVFLLAVSVVFYGAIAFAIGSVARFFGII